MSIAPTNPSTPVQPLLDGSRFRDQSRHQSPEISRAFTSAVRAASQGQQSEAHRPDEITLEPELAITDAQIIRGVD